MTIWGTRLVNRENARALYIRLREKFDLGYEMQMNYDDLEEHCAKNKAKKIRECRRKQRIAGLRNLKNNAKTTPEL